MDSSAKDTECLIVNRFMDAYEFHRLNQAEPATVRAEQSFSHIWIE